jgi:hypothetical protein
MAGRIAYTTPSVMDLYAQPFDALNGEFYPNGVTDLYDFELKVYNNEKEAMVECSDPASCRFRYGRYYTPELFDVTPANVCQDMLLEFHINVKGAHKVTPADEWPFRELRLGETLLDWESTVT